MTRSFGTLPGGETAHLYTICGVASLPGFRILERPW